MGIEASAANDWERNQPIELVEKLVVSKVEEGQEERSPYLYSHPIDEGVFPSPRPSPEEVSQISLACPDLLFCDKLLEEKDVPI